MVPGVPWRVIKVERNPALTPTPAPTTFENPDSPWARVVCRRYHFSPAGVAYVVTTMVMIVGAINGQNNLLFWLFGLGVAGLLVSGVMSGSPLMGLRLLREVESVATVGQPMRIRYTLRSRNWLVPGFALRIEELESARTWLGREVSASWSNRIPRALTGLECLRPRGTAVTDAVVTPRRRGVVVLGPVRVSSSFPFGITRKSVTLAEPRTILVRPQPADVPAEVLRIRSGVGANVGALTPSRTGMEYYSLRDYQPGDGLRSVAWRASARLDRPIVKTFATPPGQRLWVVLDCAGAAESDVEDVVSVAAGVATRSVAMGLEVGLVGPDLRVLEPVRSGRRQIDLVLDRLARFDHAQPSPGDAPEWRMSRVVAVHAGAAPNSGLPTHAGTIHARDPRVRLPLPPSESRDADGRARGWWEVLMSMLGEDPDKPDAEGRVA